MGSALRIEKLCKHYPGFVLSDVSLTLERGYVMGFIGRNGAGKTTTIRLIMGLIHKDSGSIEVLGMKQGSDDAKIRERIGFVYDEHGFYGNMTVEGMGRLTAPFYQNWSHDEYRQRVKEFDLDPKRKVRELSRGQKTKLALAIALSHRAELLVMDEPTSGLDPVFRRELIDILYKIIQDERKAIFFSSHLTSDLEKIADYVTFIDNGRIVFSESKDELRERYRIVKGPLEGLTRSARELCVGIRETRTGFEALSASAEDLAALVGNKAIVEKADLEDIMVYMVKGGENE